jgi:hypothetical protein
VYVEDYKMGLDTIVLIPLLSAFGLLYWSSQLEDQDDYVILRLLFQLLYIPLVWLSVHLAIIDVSINYASNTDLVTTLTDFVYYLGWVVFIIGVYHAFIIFKNIKDIILQKKAEKSAAMYES